MTCWLSADVASFWFQRWTASWHSLTPTSNAALSLESGTAFSDSARTRRDRRARHRIGKVTEPHDRVRRALSKGQCTSDERSGASDEWDDGVARLGLPCSAQQVARSPQRWANCKGQRLRQGRSRTTSSSRNLGRGQAPANTIGEGRGRAVRLADRQPAFYGRRPRRRSQRASILPDGCLPRAIVPTTKERSVVENKPATSSCS